MLGAPARLTNIKKILMTYGGTGPRPAPAQRDRADEPPRVARPTLREALRILEAERLVDVVRGAHGGARVREPDIRAASAHCVLLLQRQGATIADVSSYA